MREMKKLTFDKKNTETNGIVHKAITFKKVFIEPVSLSLKFKVQTSIITLANKEKNAW